MLSQYYLRTRAAVGAIKFTVDQATLSKSRKYSTQRLRLLSNYIFLLPDQAKADNKKASLALPPPVVPVVAPKAAPLSPIRDITNVPITSPTSLSKRFDDSSAPTSPVVEAPAPVVAARVAIVTPVVAATVADEPAEDGEMTFEEAIKRRELKELEQATLMCSLENKEACLMCSG